jgi:hypothetical protein
MVKAELGRDSYGRYLRFTLTSAEPTPIDILGRRLPWRAAAEADILLAAVDASTREPLARVEVVDDPGPDADTDVVHIEPGESVDGCLYLGSVFDMSGARPRREIVVFWAYRPSVLGRPLGERIVGSLTVSLRDSAVGSARPPNKGMKLTSVERIGRSQLIPGVRPLIAGSGLTRTGWSGSLLP